jgi:hypothetical protein
VDFSTNSLGGALRKTQSLLSLIAVCAVAACSGAGTSSPSLPSGTQSGAAAQTQARTPQGNKKVSSGSYTLYGDATLVHPGDNSPTAVQEVWSPSQPFGGIDFGVPAGLTVSQLNNLSTDFKFTQGTCSQGSPRFQINVDGVNVFAYLGPQFPSLTNPCAGATYSNSTNVVGPASLVDATQVSGSSYETWSLFQAQHGSDIVTGIQLVVDGFTLPYITAQFDNTQINGQTFTYESADSCKDGGWQTFTSAPGPFKNQGDCVSYFNNGK